jgi:hypothetical protein
MDEVPDGASSDAADLAAEIARLREENERLARELREATSGTGGDVVASGSATAASAVAVRHRGRWFASWVLIVVGSLLVPVSVLSVWLDRTITDTDRYVETVAPLIRDPAIQQAIERRLEQALYSRIDLEAEVSQVLPDRASLLAAPITAGLRNLIDEVIHRVVTSDRVAELWDDANRIAQRQVVDVLTVSSGRKGVVQIDLTEMLKEVQSRLDQAGVPFVGGITVPDVQLEVLQSDTLASVQTAFGIFDRLVTVLPWLTLLLLGAGIAVAPDRRKGLVRASAGWVIASVLLLVAVAVGRTIYLDALPTGTSVPANTAFYDTITRFLRGSGRMVLVLGLVVLLAVLISGPSRPAVRFRAVMARLLGAAGSGVDRAGVDLGPVPAFVARNAIALRVVVAVVALGVFLLLGQPSAGAVLWIALGAVVALAVVEVLARAGGGPVTGATEAVATGDGAETAGELPADAAPISRW